MKKIGVVTIYDKNGNFGNKLQNYAVVKTYEKLGLKCETIVTEKKVPLSIIIKDYIYCILRFIIKRKPVVHLHSFRRMKNYDKFNDFLHPNYDLMKGKNITKNYDYFSIGSDQVWNPTYYEFDVKRKDIYFLTFTEPEKKICFSPSFGVEDIPKEWEQWFATQLNSFRCLSVREQAGAQIIKRLTGKDATVLIDPTLALSEQEWSSISKKPDKIDISRPYLLTYFLGGCGNKRKEDISTFASQNKLQIFNLLDIYQPNLFVIGPSEFIYLIQHSKIVFTDSFHACVFSFLFNKPFIVYDREGTNNSMNSRLETLLSKFHLERKYANSGLPNDLLEHDYTEGYKQLELERKKAMDFLKEALGEE